MIRLLATYGDNKSGDIVELSPEQEEKLIEKGFAVEYEQEEVKITNLRKEIETLGNNEERQTITVTFEDGTSETLEVYTLKELKALGAPEQKEIIEKMGENPEEAEFSNADKRVAFIMNVYEENMK